MATSKKPSTPKSKVTSEAAKTKTKPDSASTKKVAFRPRRGPKKAPIETRSKRSANPHKNRVGPPDVPKSEDPGGWTSLPDKPEFKGVTALDEDGRMEWDRIVGTQLRRGKHAWLWAEDIAAIIVVCRAYSIWVKAWREANYTRSKNESFYDEINGRVHAIHQFELKARDAYSTSLRLVGDDPSRRQVVDLAAVSEGVDGSGLA